MLARGTLLKVKLKYPIVSIVRFIFTLLPCLLLIQKLLNWSIDEIHRGCLLLLLHHEQVGLLTNIAYFKCSLIYC